jgi:hypothetical protein
MAVPVTASLKVLFRRYIWQKRLQPRVSQSVDEEDAS